MRLIKNGCRQFVEKKYPVILKQKIGKKLPASLQQLLKVDKTEALKKQA